MSRTWKWILGILAVLVLVGIVVGAVFMRQNHMAWWNPRGFTYSAPGAPGSQQGQTAPNEYDGLRRYHMDDRAWRMPMMRAGGVQGPYAFGPFGMGFMIFAGLIRLVLPLGVLALVAYLFYRMGRRAGVASATTSPSAPRPDVKPLPARKVARR
jgi:hypothetical protein